MITKKYLLEQIERVEKIIQNTKNEIKIKDYCTTEDIKNLKNFKVSDNYRKYKKKYQCIIYLIFNLSILKIIVLTVVLKKKYY